MNDKDVFKYGEDIFNSINRAAETGNFSNLSRDVRDTINGAANSFLDSIKRGVSSWRKDTRTPFFSVRVKKNKGKGKIVVGSIISFSALMSLISQSLSLILSDIGLWLKLSAGSLLGLGLGIGLIIAGKKNRNLIKNYFNFGNIIGNRSYVTMEELSDKTGIPTDDVISQIKQMKRQSYLPYAIIDKAETTLMLTDDVYKEYIKSKMYHSNQAKRADTSQTQSKQNESSAKVQYVTIDENLPKDVQSIL